MTKRVELKLVVIKDFEEDKYYLLLVIDFAIKLLCKPKLTVAETRLFRGQTSNEVSYTLQLIITVYCIQNQILCKLKAHSLFLL